MSRHDQPTNSVPLSGAEIAGFMNWRGPGAYTAHARRRVVRLIAEAVRREREACAKAAETCFVGWPMDGGEQRHVCARAIRARGAA